MKERSLFLSVLLFAQLTLSITVGFLPGEEVRHAAMLGTMLLPCLLLYRAPKGTHPLRFIPYRGALPLLLLLPAFILAVAAISIGWGELAALFGFTPKGGDPVEPLALAIVLDAAVPAIGEEILMRGVVFSVLRPHGRSTAVIGSALLFALMHASLAQLPYAAIAGILLGMLYELSGSLLFPILFHFCSNLLSLLLMFGAPLLPLFCGLAAAAFVGLAILLLAVRPKLRSNRAEGEAGGLCELFLSPLLFWVCAILFFMLL